MDRISTCEALGAILQKHDQIVLCTVDYLLASGSKELSQKVKELKQTIRRWYRYYGSPQDEVWVVAHPIMRQD